MIARAMQPGDFVTIVEPSPGHMTLTWEVEAIYPGASADGPLAYLRSGLTGRHRYELVENLALYQTADGTYRRIIE